MADRLRNDGTVKMDVSSTDHLPIIAKVNARVQQAKNKTTVHKRCMKNFNNKNELDA